MWSSAGAHGQVDGAVSFTRLGPHRTQVLLVLDWPQGRFARTDNLWPARARRVRLNLEQFHRRAMAQVLVRQKQVQGWRGEIRHSNVVTTHEQASKEQRRSRSRVPRKRRTQEEPTPRERIAKDQSAPDAAADEYTAADQGEDRPGRREGPDRRGRFEAGRVRSPWMTDHTSAFDGCASSKIQKHFGIARAKSAGQAGNDAARLAPASFSGVLVFRSFR